VIAIARSAPPRRFGPNDSELRARVFCVLVLCSSQHHCAAFPYTRRVSAAITPAAAKTHPPGIKVIQLCLGVGVRQAGLERCRILYALLLNFGLRRLRSTSISARQKGFKMGQQRGWLMVYLQQPGIRLQAEACIAAAGTHGVVERQRTLLRVQKP
jgi:hypothetical protein